MDMDTYRREFDRARRFAVEYGYAGISSDFARWHLSQDVEDSNLHSSLSNFLADREEGAL